MRDDWRGLMARWIVIGLLTFILGVAAILQLGAIGRIISPSWSDLFPQWTATVAALHGKDPYSQEVTETIQRGFYGHVLRHDENWDRQAFVYPAHLVLLLAPFAFLPWRLVHLFFAVATPLFLFLALYSWIRVCDLHPGRISAAVFYVLSLTSWPAIWAYQQQQPTVPVAAMLALSVLCLQRGADLPAAVLLAAATVKPTLVLPLLAWLLILALFHRRWRFLVTFAGTVCVLLASSEAIMPGWIPRWLQAAHTYALEALHATALVHLFGATGGLAAALLFGVALAVRLWQLRPNWAYADGFATSAALLLAFTLCILPTTIWMNYNQILLIPAILLLVFSHPKPMLDRFFRGLALTALGWTLVCVPLCAGLALLIGYRPGLAVLPFYSLFLPPVVFLGLLAQRPDPSGPGQVSPGKAGGHLLS